MITRMILLLISLIFPGILLTAQERYLVLDRPGKKKDISYFPSDKIIFRMKWEKFNRHDKIVDFTDSTIIFDSYEVVVKDIDFVRTTRSNGFFSPSNGPKLIIAGLALPLVDYINYKVVEGNDYVPNQAVMIVSGCLISVGAIWTSLRFNKFRTEGNRKIIISSL
jgi:hypothetical protein